MVHSSMPSPMHAALIGALILPTVPSFHGRNNSAHSNTPIATSPHLVQLSCVVFVAPAPQSNQGTSFAPFSFYKELYVQSAQCTRPTPPHGHGRLSMQHQTKCSTKPNAAWSHDHPVWHLL